MLLAECFFLLAVCQSDRYTRTSRCYPTKKSDFHPAKARKFVSRMQGKAFGSGITRSTWKVIRDDVLGPLWRKRRSETPRGEGAAFVG